MSSQDSDKIKKLLNFAFKFETIDLQDRMEELLNELEIESKQIMLEGKTYNKGNSFEIKTTYSKIILSVANEVYTIFIDPSMVVAVINSRRRKEDGTIDNLSYSKDFKNELDLREIKTLIQKHKDIHDEKI